MINIVKPILLLMIGLIPYASFGQFGFDIYRYGVPRYFSQEDFINKKRFHDNFIQVIPAYDSLKLTVADTTIYTFQKRYRRTRKSKRIFFGYGQRMMKTSAAVNQTSIYNCRVIEVLEDNTHCLCRVRLYRNGKRISRKREVVIENNQIEGVVLGISSVPRTMLITYLTLKMTKLSFDSYYQED
jgi:hypothetical protein